MRELETETKATYRWKHKHFIIELWDNPETGRWDGQSECQRCGWKSPRIRGAVSTFGPSSHLEARDAMTTIGALNHPDCPK